MMIAGAIAEMLSLALIVPFLGILAGSNHTNMLPSTVAAVLNTLEADRPETLIILLTALFCCVVIVSAALRMALLWAGSRTSNTIVADISYDLYLRTLYQPYTYHISRNSAETISGITQRVEGVGAIFAACQIFASSSALLVGISIALFAIDPLVSVLIGITFGCIYWIVSYVVRTRVDEIALTMRKESTLIQKSLQEGFGGIRDVILDGAQSFYAEIYRRSDRPLRQASANLNIVTGMPRIVMEGTALITISVTGLSLYIYTAGESSFLPTLGAMVFGAQRLLPALQQIYGSVIMIRANTILLGDVLRTLEIPVSKADPESILPVVTFRKSIELKNLSFRYASAEMDSLSVVNVSIPYGTVVGVVGASGSGKSTFLDIIMGLLIPSSGTLNVDGNPIEGTKIRAWQKLISHVPQSIFLFDTTFAENVALVVNQEDLDMVRIQRAAKAACIADLIESRPLQYMTEIGERGVRLSGGQRQRIGIARAFYKEAPVLILDEATSALDGITEQAVMKAIRSCDEKRTVIIVAHRISTIRECDTILVFDNGHLVAQGSYDDLIKTTPKFVELATLTETNA